jgi:hypothetical protein
MRDNRERFCGYIPTRVVLDDGAKTTGATVVASDQKLANAYGSHLAEVHGVAVNPKVLIVTVGNEASARSSRSRSSVGFSGAFAHGTSTWEPTGPAPRKLPRPN